MRPEWTNFKGGVWEREINVRDFIQKNYTPYDGDDTFLVGPTQNTTDLWNQVLELSKQEREKGGVLDMDTKVISTITSHGPGYLNKDKETIVGFQTDKPFKRSLQPYGGIRMAVKACQDNGYEVDPEIVEFSLLIERHTTLVYLMHILQKCVLAVPATSSPDFRMHMAVDVSSATTVVSHCTVLTV